VKKLTLNGAAVAARMTDISSRNVSGFSMAHGIEPKPPASHTAMQSSAPCEPAIGA
jgi:hypothetical protein